MSRGTAAISYTITNSCGTTSATAVVTVQNTVSAISGNTTVCTGSVTALSDSAASGVWSSSDSIVAAVDISGNVTGVSAGTAIITYTVTNLCGTTSAMDTITVNPAAAAITGIDTVIVGAVTILSDDSLGEIWSTSDSAVATIDSSGNVTGISQGTAVITYGISGECSRSVTVTVQRTAAAICR